MKGGSARRIEQAKIFFAELGKISTRSQFGGYGLLADGTMFAVVAEGELYLRATESLEPVFRGRGMTNMTYLKRGVPMTMRYYRVDERLWSERQELSALALQAVREARKEIKVRKRRKGRLKDLPNIDVSLERLLWRSGVQNIYELRLLGAEQAYLRLLEQQKSLGIKILMSLAGAMAGYHHVALPRWRRKELTEWFDATIVIIPSGFEARTEKRVFRQHINN
ncbi:TfoX/Sxy family DNA transformation protein [Serratia sp. UGAL515B_01]|uniref:TfoX/Sxy family DNA transformation protein n=1 Tax=Serratia sp. UGAL515B_01 TaxID=2986763 RepID=UPI0029531768|nr:TfoX/Sxy family DNA transformation protein [Serratia sp. UGAL515B_01]WON78242.1 TfoX/Sxy family DNA transformation protein [Serratia sp. UGAL515B_01]